MMHIITKVQLIKACNFLMFLFTLQQKKAQDPNKNKFYENPWLLIQIRCLQYYIFKNIKTIKDFLKFY